MKVAIVGSRGLKLDNLKEYLPPETTELVSGWEEGIDAYARKCAEENNLKFTEIPLGFRRDGKADYVQRNARMIAYSNMVLVFWDEKSRGAHYMIDQCRRFNAQFKVIIVK